MLTRLILATRKDSQTDGRTDIVKSVSQKLFHKDLVFFLPPQSINYISTAWTLELSVAGPRLWFWDFFLSNFKKFLTRNKCFA